MIHVGKDKSYMSKYISEKELVMTFSLLLHTKLLDYTCKES